MNILRYHLAVLEVSLRQGLLGWPKVWANFFTISLEAYLCLIMYM